MDSNQTKAVNGFMNRICNRNILKAYRFTQISWKKTNNKNKLSRMFAGIKIRDHKIISHEVLSEHSIKVRVEYSQGDERYYSNVMVICELDIFKPSPKGKWGVNPISFLRNEKVEI